MDFHMGRQELGCTRLDPYWCQDAFPGLVRPFGATGGQFGAISHIFRILGGSPLLFPYWPFKGPWLFGVMCCCHLGIGSVQNALVAGKVWNHIRLQASVSGAGNPHP